jgi:hypothetical protein
MISLFCFIEIFVVRYSDFYCYCIDKKLNNILFNFLYKNNCINFNKINKIY